MSAGKAFLMGMLKGGLKSNNDRAQRMEERMLQLADQNAAMATERAKSAYDRTTKEAQAITSTETQLRDNEFIDQEGNYTTKYYDNEAVTAWADPEIRKSLGADGDFKAFRDKWAVLKKKRRFVNPYKSPEQREADLSKLYQSISTTQQIEATQPVLTGLDKLLMRGTSSAINTVGGDSESFVPREAQEVPELTEVSPMRSTTSTNPTEEYVSPEFTTLKKPSTLDPENHMKVYSKDAEGGVDTSSVRSVFVNTSDGKLYEATPEGAVPFEGDWVDAHTFDTKAPSTPIKQAALSSFRGDIDKELEEKFQGANKTLRLTKGIAELAGVETAAVVSTLPAKISEFFGTEWAALQSEASKQDFMKDKINSIVSLDEGAQPETLTEISSALGSMESMKLALAYASVKMNRGGGRFSAQELNTQLALFKDRSLPFMLSSLNTTYKDALSSIKRDVKNMAAQASVNHLYNKGVPNSYSQVKGNLTTEPRQDAKGNWVVLIDEGSRETYGAKYIIVTPDGGVQYK